MLRFAFFIRSSSILYLALVLHIVNGQVRNRETMETNLETDKEFRRNKAKEVLKYMNLSTNPCDDFYDFACGQWDNYEKSENPDGLITNQLQLEHLVNKELQQVLAHTGSQDPESTRKVKDFYRSCLAVEKSTSQFRSFVLSFVRKYGGLPSLQNTNWQASNNWLQVIALLRANYGMDILIGLEVDSRLNAMRGNQILLTEPKTTLLPPNLCSSLATETIDQHDETYNTIQREVADNMQAWFSWNAAESNRLAGDIVRFEFELCKDMRKHHSIRTQNGEAQTERSTMRGGRRNEHKSDTPFLHDTLDKLTNHFREVIDFKKFIYFTLNITNNEMVYMHSEKYFQRLAGTLRSNSKQTLATYVMYRALINFAIPNENRPKYCVEQVLRYYPKQIGELYNRKMYRGEIKSDVELLTKDIFKSFIDQLETVSWLEHNDKNAIKQRFSQFELRLPNYQNLDFDDVTIKSSNYWSKLESAMKYNAMQKLDPLYGGEYFVGAATLESTTPDVKFTNKYILLGWGLLQKPYYYYYFPKALKYSLVGQRIARELVAAFSEQQWSDSLVVTTPWNENTLKGYRNRSECLRKQYSNYLHNDPDVFQNASKLQDLILTNSGLNVAFNAYLHWLYETDYRPYLVRETLPELNFSNTQLFFINYAQMHCASKYKDNPPLVYFPLDKHTPERYQVNGPLINCPEFAREFGCAIGTEMNPDDKCVIY